MHGKNTRCCFNCSHATWSWVLRTRQTNGSLTRERRRSKKSFGIRETAGYFFDGQVFIVEASAALVRPMQNRRGGASIFRNLVVTSLGKFHARAGSRQNITIIGLLAF